ncbi:ABC transporter permease subunit [Embleya sp. NBC_00896]|uniref:ABC transporter permease subunit n=1 Tax=Embleya sp. NBC_00896 TaxID=2975961 RepID=UPI003870B379|nr:ABC transporter permease subunit [Embleya sp. NBC_00896]
MSTTRTPYRSTVTGGRDTFRGLLRAEWTKLRSVPRWLLTLTAAVLLIVLVGLLLAAGSRSVAHVGGGTGERPKIKSAEHFDDGGHFVRRELAGDGELVARVVAQERGGGWAKAGLMIRAGDGWGAAFAAIMITPDHGVRLQSGYDSDTIGRRGTVPRWLKLVRAGHGVTTYESADGVAWNRVGKVDLGALPEVAQVGLFVAVPDKVEVERQFGGEGISGQTADTQATFDHVSLTPARPQPAAPWKDRPRSSPPGTSTETAGTFTLTGSGEIGPSRYGDDDIRTILSGVLVGLMAIVALAVLSVTSEFHRGMIRTTFATSPRRGRVLAAKTVVIGSVTFVAGLIAAFGAFLATRPLLRSGNRIPAGLSDPNVLRAVVGTAALLALIAVFALAVGTILRRGAPAITIVLVLLLAPRIIATGLPVSTAVWLERLTPAAGFAIQQTFRRYDTAIGAWPGLAVLAGYTALALAVALWRLRRRDA